MQEEKQDTRRMRVHLPRADINKLKKKKRISVAVKAKALGITKGMELYVYASATGELVLCRVRFMYPMFFRKGYYTLALAAA